MTCLTVHTNFDTNVERLVTPDLDTRDAGQGPGQVHTMYYTTMHHTQARLAAHLQQAADGQDSGKSPVECRRLTTNLLY